MKVVLSEDLLNALNFSSDHQHKSKKKRPNDNYAKPKEIKVVKKK